MRPIPSASAMSVTVAPEASALAIRARRLSRRSSAVGLDCASSVIGVLCLLTRANRHDTFVYAFNFRVGDENEAAGAADASRGVKGEASRWCEEYLWSQGGLCDQTSQTHAGRTPAT